MPLLCSLIAAAVLARLAWVVWLVFSTNSADFE